MRKLFSFRSSSSNGNDNCTPELNKSRKKVNSGLTKEINATISTQERIYGNFQTPEDYVLKPLNHNLENVSSSNPCLRRSLSLTSAAICSRLNEASFSSSSDQSRMTSCQDSDQHLGRYPCRNQNSSTLDRYARAERESLLLNAIEKPSSPNQTLRCRTARTNQISSHNNVLDLYIDGEHKVTKTKIDPKKCASETREDAKLVGSNKKSVIERPPRALCTAPNSLRSVENPRSYSFREIKAHCSNLSNRQWTSDDLRPEFQHKYLENNIDRTCESLEKSISGIRECKAQVNVALEDMYEDSSDWNPDTTVQGCSFDLIPLDKKFNGDWFYEPFNSQRKDFLSSRGSKASELDELSNFMLQEHATNEDLLKSLKELGESYDFLSEKDLESKKHYYGSLNEAALLQNIMTIEENRKHLTAELSSQIRSRLAERFFANERLKQAKLELNTRTRRLESEKNELQLSLENEIDRRSNDWSSKLSKFQAEEQRLRDRVRELAEQNVSLQREISLFRGSEVETRKSVVNLENQLNESRASQDELTVENLELRRTLLELQECCDGAEEQRDHVKIRSKEIEKENMELHKLVGRLQRTCNEQDKTISGLRQSYGNEDENIFLERDVDIVQLQREKLRLACVEQKLTGELEYCRIEAESLRNENSQLLNRLQGAENGYGLSFVRLNVELHAWLECLKMQSLSLLDDGKRLCGQLLDFVASQRSENCENTNSDTETYCAVDLTFKYQTLMRSIGSFRRSLKIVSTTIEEKESIEASKCLCQKAETDSSKQQKAHRSEDDMEMELKAETLLTTLLREKIYYRELEIEQLHRDLASSIRRCDVLSNDIQRLKDEVSCLNHRKKEIEIQMQKRDENILLLQQDLEGCSRDLTVTKSRLMAVSEERDQISEEMKQLREKNMIMDSELKALHKKIELLDEDVLYKEGQISILKDSLRIKAFDII